MTSGPTAVIPSVTAPWMARPAMELGDSADDRETPHIRITLAVPESEENGVQSGPARRCGCPPKAKRRPDRGDGSGGKRKQGPETLRFPEGKRPEEAVIRE